MKMFVRNLSIFLQTFSFLDPRDLDDIEDDTLRLEKQIDHMGKLMKLFNAEANLNGWREASVLHANQFNLLLAPILPAGV